MGTYCAIKLFWNTTINSFQSNTIIWIKNLSIGTKLNIQMICQIALVPRILLSNSVCFIWNMYLFIWVFLLTSMNNIPQEHGQTLTYNDQILYDRKDGRPNCAKYFGASHRCRLFCIKRVVSLLFSRWVYRSNNTNALI